MPENDPTYTAYQRVHCSYIQNSKITSYFQLNQPVVSLYLPEIWGFWVLLYTETI